MGEILRSVGEVFNSLIPDTGNQFLDGMLVTGLLSVITLLVRGIPAKISALVVRYFTTEMMFTSANGSFHDVMKWLDKNGHSARVRRSQIRNGRWGSDSKSVKGVGDGKHVILHPRSGSIFKRKLFVLTLEKVDASFSENEKERLSVMTFGRSHDQLNKLLEESKQVAKAYEGTNVQKYDEYWMEIGVVPGRKLSSVVMRVETRKLLLDRIDRFMAAESWYVEHGIPWHLGIMLYGPPGTGKSSLVRAIADRLGKGICSLPAHKIFRIDSAMAQADNDSIVVIEDVDTAWEVKAREELFRKMEEKLSDEEEPPVRDSKKDPVVTTVRKPKRKKTETSEDGEGGQVLFGTGGLSLILNVLDGLESGHGRIIVLTANSIADLDPALLRPGRIDICLEIGNLDDECFAEMLLRFFPNRKLSPTYAVRDGVMPAGVQEDVVRGMTFDEIAEKYRKE